LAAVGANAWVIGCVDVVVWPTIGTEHQDPLVSGPVQVHEVGVAQQVPKAVLVLERKERLRIHGQMLQPVVAAAGISSREARYVDVPLTREDVAVLAALAQAAALAVQRSDRDTQ